MKAAKGFTLIEVLVTTAVLAFGIVSVFQALFIVMAAFNRISHYLNIIPVVDEKMWEAKDAVSRSGSRASLTPAGEFTAGGHTYEWAVLSSLSSSAGDLYKIDLRVQWKEGRKDFSLERSAYVVYDAGNEKKE